MTQLKITKPTFRLVSFLIIYCFHQFCFAAPSEISSESLALKGLRSWSAFECSILASKSGDTREQERLFKLGYSEGLLFLQALRDKKITQDHLKSTVPYILLLLIEGPNDDFILGRVYASVEKSVLDDIYNTDGKLNSDEIQKIKASSKFRKCNCQLLLATP